MYLKTQFLRTPTRFITLATYVALIAFVQLTRPARAQPFSGHVITLLASGANSVYTADVDGDGDVDVLSASEYDNKIAWFENDGHENFSGHVITLLAGGAKSVFAADVDSDGDMDVLSASEYDDKIAWFENDGHQSFSGHVITLLASGANSVYALDIDGDGDVDVLSASKFDDKIAWYENNGSETFSPHNITLLADGARSVYATDVDGDGDVDVLSASEVDNKIAWYENNGSETFSPHNITLLANGARSVYAADVDGDGHVDVLAASNLANAITWYENDGAESFTGHVITSLAHGASSVYAADVDGDGHVDVLAASNLANAITWYENDGAETFTGHVITSLAHGASSVYAADLDGDGDLDVLSASQADNKIAWFENLINTAPTADAGPDQTIVVGEMVTLDGSASSDPDNDAITFGWTLGGPGSPTLSDATTEMPTFCAANEGAYTATLTVNDGIADSDPDTAYVTALSADEALDVQIAAVEAFGPDGDGTLNSGQLRALTRKLDQVQRLLGKGKTDEALAVLADYLTQLDDLEEEGVLSSEQNEDLTTPAEALGAATETPCGVVSKGATAMTTGGDELPEDHVLEAAYPNPFNPSTTIPFKLREDGRIRLTVYDVMGRQVARLVDSRMDAGRHEVSFQAGNLPSGTYLVRLQAGAVVETTRIMLVK